MGVAIVVPASPRPSRTQGVPPNYMVDLKSTKPEGTDRIVHPTVCATGEPPVATSLAEHNIARLGVDVPDAVSL